MDNCNSSENKLREAVNSMDGMAQKAFSEIASMARLALLVMEQPSTYGNGSGLDSIADMLNAIKSTAQDINNCINATAEGVGCNYVDADKRRRWGAQREARKASTSGTV